jgi:hypothetical protein
MNRKRIAGALILALASLGIGYGIGLSRAVATPSVPAVTVTAPPADSVRVVYSLTAKQNDKEIIALITNAKSRVYFAVYTFTLPSIAEALVAAKKRGLDVRGIVDSGQSRESFSSGVMKILTDGGVPVVTERHPDGTGIMHIKAIVTDTAYAMGSYNWTKSATNVNDELLEIGTDETVRRAYETILRQLLDTYKNNAAAQAAAPVFIGPIPYTEAAQHIGEYAHVTGTLVSTYVSKNGVTYLDFCANYKSCPFTALIFSDDRSKFSSLDSYVGEQITLSGKITSYQGKTEIVLNKSTQLTR